MHHRLPNRLSLLPMEEGVGKTDGQACHRDFSVFQSNCTPSLELGTITAQRCSNHCDAVDDVTPLDMEWFVSPTVRLPMGATILTRQEERRHVLALVFCFCIPARRWRPGSNQVTFTFEISKYSNQL